MPVGLITAGATALGVSAATAATVGAIGGGILEGAAGGALVSGVTGGDPGLGALTGAFTGGLGGAGGAFAGDIGLSATEGTALGGALGGAIGSGVTGGNPLVGGLEGGAAGFVQGGGLNGVFGGTPSGATGTPTGTTAASGIPSVNNALTSSSVDLTGATSGTGGDILTTGGSVAPPSGVSAGAAVAGTSGLSIAPSGAASGGGVLDSISNTLGLNSAPATALPQGASTAIPASVPGAGGVGGLQVGSTVPGASPGVGGLTIGGGAAAPASSVSKFLDNPSLGTAGGILASNPGAAVSALGLGYDAIKGNQTPVGLAPLQSEAAALAAQGTELKSALNGQLPPGAKTAVDQATQSAKASIRSQYAAMGLSGSSMEAQALAGVDQTAATQTFNFAQQLLNSGIQESQLSAELYTQIMQAQQQQNTALMSGITNFAASLAGGTGTGKAA